MKNKKGVFMDKEQNEMADLHFTVRDKNGRAWGVWGDKLEGFKKHIDDMDKPLTPEEEQKLNEFKDKMLSGMIDNRLQKK